MKKFLFSSFWKLSVLALAMLMVWGISLQVFAHTDSDYLAFTPSGCPSNMKVWHLNSGDIAGGATLSSLPFIPSWFSWVIFVIDDVPTEITANITITSDCVALVANADVAGNTVLNFSWGAYLYNNGSNNIMVAGIDDTHRLGILWTTSPAGIVFENTTWARVSYTNLSGFSVLWWLVLTNNKNAVVTNNIMSNNKYGVQFQSSSTSTIQYNTFSNNTERGIWLTAWSNGNTISNNTVTNNKDGMLLWWIIWGTVSNNIVSGNTQDGIVLWATTSQTTLSNNTITNNVRYWVSLVTSNVTGNTITSNTLNNNMVGLSIVWSKNNTFTSNTVSASTIGIHLDWAQSNTFTSNTITANTTYGIYLLASASGNVFNSDTFSWNNNYTIYLNNSHYNQFTNSTVRNNVKGINLTTSTFNTFSGVNVFSNNSGTVFNASSNNTLRLVNNNNTIYLTNASNSNNVYNDQSANTPINNIIIGNNSTSNIITWWLFSADSTLTQSVYILFLANNRGTPTYSVTWAWLSGSYPTTSMVGLTGTTIELTWWSNTRKDIIVNYNGNTQYDSIYLWTIVTPPSGGGWGGWGGWGGVVSCTSSQLVCSGGVRTRVTWASCSSSLIGNSCTIGTSTGTQPVGSIAWSTFSDEMNEAYLRAYANGITTMSTIQKANMTGKLIRSHMAKMISNFAITIAWLTPDTSLDCTFNDIGNQSSEMKFYIKLSCQLGLMGQGITNFDPKGEITRGQFGTIMSRLIRWTTYDGWTPYYLAHLNALKAAGIMTQISNPSMKEIRWYVMIMMKRTYEWGFLNN